VTTTLPATATYDFTEPNPRTTSVRVGGTITARVFIFLLLVLSLLGLLSLLAAVAGMIAAVVGALLSDYLIRRNWGKGNGIELTADCLVLRTRTWTRQYGWRDISSIQVGSEAKSRGLGGLLQRTFFQGSVGSHVRLVFSRRIGSPVMGKAFDVYLTEPEAFADEARRYLSANTAA
jgi:hypothetical protein